MLRRRNLAGLVLATLVGAFVARAVPAWHPASAQDEGDPRRKTARGYKSITVRFMAGQAAEEVSVETVKRYGVESPLGESGPKMLGIESVSGQRVYVDVSRIIVIQMEPEDPAEQPPVAPK